MSRAIVFVCTNGSTDRAARLLSTFSELAESAAPGTDVELYIVHDNSEAVVGSSATTTLQDQSCNLLGPRFQKKLDAWIAMMPDVCRSEYTRSCKRLGSGLWDAGGVRNFAFLIAYLLTSTEDRIVFLDDDILFTNTVLEGQQIVVRGDTVVGELLLPVPEHQSVGRGASLWGCIDATIARHVRLNWERITYLTGDSLPHSTSQNHLIERQLEFPDRLPLYCDLPSSPYRFTPRVDRSDFGPGKMSGAVTVTNRQAVYDHNLPRCYNEDWIWQLFLQDIKISTEKVVHVPSKRRATTNFCAYQQLGEIIYASICSLFDGDELLDKGSCWSIDRLSPGIVAAAKANQLHLLAELVNTIQRGEQSILSHTSYRRSEIEPNVRQQIWFVNEVIQEIEQTNDREVMKFIHTYLTHFQAWQELLTNLGAYKSRADVLDLLSQS